MNSTQEQPTLTSEALQSMEAMKQAFLSARQLILENAGNVVSTEKSDGSSVTLIDVEVERMVKTYVEKFVPSIPVFGEEGGYENKLPGLCWIIDPIDGTSSFIKNSKTFTCMAALIKDDQAIASIIYNPTTNDMYTAVRGEGAYKNDHKLLLDIVALPAKAACKGRFIPKLNEILVGVGVLADMAPDGAGFGFTEIVEGRWAARFQMLSRGSAHDYAPGALLVTEAGGAVIPIFDDRYTYRCTSFVACHPDLAIVVQSSLTLLRELEKAQR